MPLDRLQPPSLAVARDRGTQHHPSRRCYIQTIELCKIILSYVAMAEALGVAIKRVILITILVIGWSAPAWADFQASLDAYECGDYSTAVHEWKPLAERGDSNAQFKLDVTYGKGQGVPRDYAEQCCPATV